MPLKLVKRKNRPYWYIHGSVRGIRVRESTKVSSKSVAREIMVEREARLLQASIYGIASVVTFQEAVESYLQLGGERRFLGPILDVIGDLRLADINQETLDVTAARLYRDCVPGTQIRQFYSPVSAVLNHAAAKEIGRASCRERV